MTCEIQDVVRVIVILKGETVTIKVTIIKIDSLYMENAIFSVVHTIFGFAPCQVRRVLVVIILCYKDSAIYYTVQIIRLLFYMLCSMFCQINNNAPCFHNRGH